MRTERRKRVSGYTKLFGSIVHSTIWREANHVRIVWITMLAIADPDGRVEASIPGLADASRVSLEECLEALEKLLGPDKFSRNKHFEGRRIIEIEGGWRLLNHRYYQQLMSAEERRERDRIRKADKRAMQKQLADGLSAERPRLSENVRDVSHSDPDPDPDPDPGDPPVVPPLGGNPTASEPKKPPKKRATTLPPAFEPNAGHRSLSAEEGVDLQAEFPKFLDHHQSRGTVFSDWDAALRNWIRKAREYGGPRVVPGGGRGMSRQEQALREQAARVRQLRAEEAAE